MSDVWTLFLGVIVGWVMAMASFYGGATMEFFLDWLDARRRQWNRL